MSVTVMSRVWQLSAAKGTELLLLLAIADFADDAGRAFPSVHTLSEKVRLTERPVRYLLRKLERMGELKTTVAGGPHGANLYHIQPPAKSAPGYTAPEGGLHSAGGGLHSAENVRQTAPDPPVTIKDPPKDPPKPARHKPIDDDFLAQLQREHPRVVVRELYELAQNRKTWEGYLDKRQALRNRIKFKEQESPYAISQRPTSPHSNHGDWHGAAWGAPNPYSLEEHRKRGSVIDILDEDETDTDDPGGTGSAAGGGD
jgi:Helix-turn-helix domain